MLFTKKQEENIINNSLSEEITTNFPKHPCITNVPSEKKNYFQDIYSNLMLSHQMVNLSPKRGIACQLKTNSNTIFPSINQPIKAFNNFIKSNNSKKMVNNMMNENSQQKTTPLRKTSFQSSKRSSSVKEGCKDLQKQPKKEEEKELNIGESQGEIESNSGEEVSLNSLFMIMQRWLTKISLNLIKNYLKTETKSKNLSKRK